MTTPPALPEAEFASEADVEHEMSRITVLVGERSVDVALPNRVSISEFVNDVVDLANAAREEHGAFDLTEGRWTLAHLTGDAIDPTLSLTEADVHDGEFLVVHEVSGPRFSSLVDDVGAAGEFDGALRQWLAEHGGRATCFGIGAVLAAVTAALLGRGPALHAAVAGVPLAAAAMLLAGIACAAAACLLPSATRDHTGVAGLGGVALPLVFGGSIHLLPHGSAVEVLPMAMALTALTAVVLSLTGRRGRAVYTAVVMTAIAGVPACTAYLLFHLNPRAVGAVLATVAVILVYRGPKMTIVLSGLPVPKVPTAGEPLEDVDMQGGTAVEGVGAVGKQVVPTEAGMSDRVRHAGDHLTGIVVAAAVLAVVGCYFAVDVVHGFYWQGPVFAFAVAAVLCLRGRTHHQLAQSAGLIGAGLVIALATIVKIATRVNGWPVDAAAALMALAALTVWCGLVAPRLSVSPVVRRRVEILELMAIALLVPLACWITGTYAFFRELHV